MNESLASRNVIAGSTDPSSPVAASRGSATCDGLLDPKALGPGCRRDVPKQGHGVSEEALVAGLSVLARSLERRHPGRRFFFEAGPGNGRAELVGRREIDGSLA